MRSEKILERSARHDPNDEWLGRWPAAATAPVSEHISIARSAPELDDIAQLRYALYIERDGKRYAAVDHAARKFIEPIDQVSLNFQARIDGRLLSSVRGTRAEDALHDEHLRLLLEEYPPGCIAGTVVCSRFATREEHRARSLIKPMFQAVFSAGLNAGARNCILGTRIELIGMFERFGFKRTNRYVRDPVASDIHVLHFDMRDIAYMRSIDSPLVEQAKRHLTEGQAAI